MPKRVTRSFTACWTCRRKRRRCDGSKPVCVTCVKANIGCDGYGKQLAWVDSATTNYDRGLRRDMSPTRTWKHQKVYDIKELDCLIDKPFADENSEQQTKPIAYHAFRVFKLGMPTGSPRLSLTETILLPLAAYSSRDRRLFHHYLRHVSYLMTPIDDERNPWKTTYPATAVYGSSSACKSLFNALLAQSAFNLVNLLHSLPEAVNECKVDGFMHYGKALSALNASLASKEEDFTAQTAALLTIAMIDGVYAKETKCWSIHFEGGAALIAKGLCRSPSLQSSDGWVIAQSLALGFEIAQTGRLTSTSDSSVFEILLESVAAQNDLGYTIGGSRAVIRSISTIRRLMQNSHNIENDLTKLRVMEVIHALEEDDEQFTEASVALPGAQSAVAEQTRRDYLRKLHRRMFRAATHIYLRRVAFNASPRQVEKYVSAVLADMSDFIDWGGGSVSIWPVFMAATEASTDDQRAFVRKWFNFSDRLGIENRVQARRVIEATWRTREMWAEAQNAEIRNVPLDWRVIQRDLDINLLLL